jgi:hypothetical protein
MSILNYNIIFIHIYYSDFLIKKGISFKFLIEIELQLNL